MFKRKNMKTGMIVETKSGDLYIYIDGVFRGNGNYIRENSYDRNMKCLLADKSKEIVRIYMHKSIWNIKNVFQKDDLYVVWEKVNTKKEKDNDGWNPIITCGYPKPMILVDVTYEDNNERYVGSSMYIGSDDEWHSEFGCIGKDKVIAWRYKNPYMG